MITVSSCGVKLQEVLSGLERERLKHWRYTCTFVAFLNITFFLSTCGVRCNVVVKKGEKKELLLSFQVPKVHNLAQAILSMCEYGDIKTVDTAVPVLQEI